MLPVLIHHDEGENAKESKLTIDLPSHSYISLYPGPSIWDEFRKPKLIWKRVGSIVRFSFDEKGVLGLDSTCFATGKHIPYLCCILNSSMGHYLLNGAPRTGTGDLLVSVQAVEPVKVPPVSGDETIYHELVNRFIYAPSAEIENEIDSIIFNLYNLNTEERNFIINNFR